MSHAKLSPSAAYRWLACPGSVALIGDQKDESSEYADEGTAAHTLASWCLDSRFNAAHFRDAIIHVKNEDGSVRRTFVVDEDMASYVQVYCDAVRDHVADNDDMMLIEQKLDSGLRSTRYGAVTGTGDAVIIKPAKKLIVAKDLKYGRGVKVFAAGNPQTRLYGLGALNLARLFFGIDDTWRVLMTIDQPRLDHYDEELLTVQELLEWCDYAAYAIAGIDTSHVNELNPGEKQCKFCPAAHRCPALEKQATAAALINFADVADLTEHGIGSAMDKVELVETWCGAVRQEARRLLDAGTKVPGWTLEEGRQGNRKWVDEDAVALELSELGEAVMYKPRQLISPADAEKKLAKRSSTLWNKLQPLIVRGAPTVNMVRDDGKRTPYSPASLDAFKEIA